jgi:hypothetical protein
MFLKTEFSHRERKDHKVQEVYCSLYVLCGAIVETYRGLRRCQERGRLARELIW